MANMERPELSDAARFWVPLLTHYRHAASGTVEVDGARMAAQLRSLRPWLTHILLAGSTGDGWELDDIGWRQVLAAVEAPGAVAPERGVLVGCLGRTTEDVVRRARLAEEWGRGPGKDRCYRGLVVCPPVKAEASQAEIRRHYEAVLAATESALAVYQLPQVTQCEVAPETLEALVRDNPRITLFKDTSGTDKVASSGRDFGRLILLRGAEGGYFEALKPHGRYDGWLLSTGNGLAKPLREILVLWRAGRSAEARRLSDRLTGLVLRLFERAAALPSGNPFSNANRALDHVAAYGAAWRHAEPPLIRSGERLPAEFLSLAASELKAAGLMTDGGYLSGAAPPSNEALRQLAGSDAAGRSDAPKV